MAEFARKHVRPMSMNGSSKIGEEKWAKHYSSNHQILLVGEGDFSFSLSLAMSFGHASNIVASSLDSYDVLIKKIQESGSKLEILRLFGARLLHGVNSMNMKHYSDLKMLKFDRIVYNFPHAGFLGKESSDFVVMMHKNLVRAFFMNAHAMLRPNGEVHVTHKTTYPYNCWNIEELATQSGSRLRQSVIFKIRDYPGYNNKRGTGRNSDDPFHIGKCSTFKFISSSKTRESTTKHRRSLQRPPEIPSQRPNASDPMTLIVGINLVQ